MDYRSKFGSPHFVDRVFVVDSFVGSSEKTVRILVNKNKEKNTLRHNVSFGVSVLALSRPSQLFYRNKMNARPSCRYSVRTPFPTQTKFDNGTYDMNDESQTEHSLPDSLIAPDDHSLKEPESLNQRQKPKKTTTPESLEDNGLSHDDGEKSRISWSDSEGSTFFSNEVEDWKKKTDFGNEAFDFVRQKDFPPGLPADIASRITGSTSPLRLQNVDYFSEVHVASCASDDISVVEFISKEATRPIFERRMVPLEVPARRRRMDEVSAFSSAKFSNSSEGATSLTKSPIDARRVRCHGNRKEAKFGVGDCTANILSIDLITPTNPGAKISGNIPKESTSIIRLPKTMLEISLNQNCDSLSSLGSVSALSERVYHWSSSEDDESYGVARRKINAEQKQRRTVAPEVGMMQQRTNTRIQDIIRKVNPSTSEKKNPEAPQSGLVPENTNTRIQALKERLRKLQELSVLESRIEGAKPVKQTDSRIDTQHCKVSSLAAENRQLIENQLAVRTIPDRALKPENQRTAPTLISKEVPAEVRRDHVNNDDDLSTLACELQDEKANKYELYDVELGAQDDCKDGPRSSRHCVQEKIGETQLKEKSPVAIIQSAALRVYQGLQGLWELHMHKRSDTEKAIIMVILLASIVLLVLLLSIAIN